MHELSVAVSLVDAVGEKAAELGVDTVGSVHVKIGALSGVVCNALEFAFEVAAKNTCLEGASLEIEDVPVRIHCPDCDADKDLADLYGYTCPDCGTQSMNVLQGRELELVSFAVAS